MHAMWKPLLGTIIFEEMNEYTLVRKYKCKLENSSLILVPLRGMSGLIQEAIPKYRM
jgi:hypothetical protein